LKTRHTGVSPAALDIGIIRETARGDAAQLRGRQAQGAVFMASAEGDWQSQHGDRHPGNDTQSTNATTIVSREEAQVVPHGDGAGHSETESSARHQRHIQAGTGDQRSTPCPRKSRRWRGSYPPIQGHNPRPRLSSASQRLQLRLAQPAVERHPEVMAEGSAFGPRRSLSRAARTLGQGPRFQSGGGPSAGCELECEAPWLAPRSTDTTPRSVNSMRLSCAG